MVMTKPACAIAGCERTDLKRSWCKKHYLAGLQAGTIQKLVPIPLSVRFWTKVQREPGGCWIWLAGHDQHGYGRFKMGGQMRIAHRIAYELKVGPIPEGMDLDHECLNPPCVNPDHLRPATRKQNMEHRTGAQSNSRSGIRGVSYRDGSWRASVKHNGRKIHAGSFSTQAEAAAAAVALRNELFTHNDIDRKVSL